MGVDYRNYLFAPGLSPGWMDLEDQAAEAVVFRLKLVHCLLPLVPSMGLMAPSVSGIRFELG